MNVASVFLLTLSAADALLVGMRPPLCAVVRPAFPSYSVVQMGRGDKRTQSGKRKAKSFGNTRPRNSKLRRERDGPSLGSAAAHSVSDDLSVTIETVEDSDELDLVEGSAQGAELEAEELMAEEETPEEEVAMATTEPAVAAVELKPAAIAACVKELRLLLPRADLKACKAAVMAAAGDVEAARAALLEELGAEWEARDASEAAALAEGLAASQALKQAKALKKFEKEEAKKVAAEPEPEPAPVAEESEAVEAESVAPAEDPEPEPTSVSVAPEKRVRLPNADDLGRVWIR